MLAHRDAQCLRISRHTCARDDQVHFGHLLVAFPEAHGVPHQIDSRASLLHFICADNILQLHSNLGAGIVERQPRERGILFQPPPMPFIGKCLAAHDPYRREQSPTADQSGLPRRPPHLVDCLQLFVMKHVSMNHAFTCPTFFKSATCRIVPEYAGAPVEPPVRYPKCSYPLRPSMVSGASVHACKSWRPKAQQYTEDSWLVGKSNLERVLLRARKRPPT